MTTRVLGLLVLVLALIIVASCFLFARAETRQNSRFSVVVGVSSLPMFVVGGLLLRKGQRMKEDEDEAD